MRAHPRYGLTALTLAAALAAPAVAAPLLGSPPVYREIKDWIVGCDNEQVCLAKFVDDPDDAWVPADGSPPAYLNVWRQPGTEGRLIVILALDEDTIDPATLRLDGKPLTGFDWSADTIGALQLEDDAAWRFVQAIRNGSVLSFNAGAGVAEVSLRGLAASLLVIDETQGRLGNETALIRIGAVPRAQLPLSPEPTAFQRGPVPAPLDETAAARLAAQVRASQEAVLQAHGCDADNHPEDAAYGLDADEAVVILGCRLAAYQGSVLAYRARVADPGRAALLVMPTPPTLEPEADLESSGEYVEGSFDPDTLTFSEAAKGRGLGDCGVSASWVFDGREFQLSEFYRQERCGGQPGDWLALYRADARDGD